MSLLERWILINLRPVKAMNYRNSSYGMKHRAEWDLGCYVSDQEFTKAMKRLGYKAVKYKSRHYFNVSRGAVNRIYKRQAKGNPPCQCRLKEYNEPIDV